MNITLLLILYGCAQLAAGACAPGWVHFQTSCYKIEAHAKKTWADAKKACIAEQSHLAIIMTTEENQFVKNKLMNLQITDVLMQFWMDGIDKTTEAIWSGKALENFLRFTTGRPASPTKMEAKKIAWHFSGGRTSGGMTSTVIVGKDMCEKQMTHVPVVG